MASQIDNLIRQGCGRKIHVFEQTIPHSVRAAEISTTGESIYQHDPKARWPQPMTTEVLANIPEKQRKLSSERISGCYFPQREQREEEKEREQVQQIPIDELHPFHQPSFQSCGR